MLPQLGEEQEVEQVVKFTEQGEATRYGNFKGYYGYRDPSQDNRLTCMESQWFNQKDVLDIGCHSGHVTFFIAENFNPKTILGVDIDQQLIHRARQRLLNKIKNYKRTKTTSEPHMQFPLNMRFQQANFVLENDDDLNYITEEYETIIAFSVTKWIHLNFGDDGIKRFFKRIYRALRPGGILLLEPQQWQSYRIKRKMTKQVWDNYRRIEFKPTQFLSYLLSSEVGFQTCHTVATPSNKHKGFERSIFMLIKANSIDTLTYLDTLSDQQPTNLPPSISSFCCFDDDLDKISTAEKIDSSSLAANADQVASLMYTDLSTLNQVQAVQKTE
ncbi:unnamed protein product [Didymodactylos carnosus]|uniref:RNA methyltransferase n=1 Tax=Didymodactylos carnosus TaxID=1234261 RepID=A0A813QG01_9BILA|nr:unnamed protein product [Didymodactylos carnosus]CAF1147425.1 unnamed protein product [Didymodactylos carnosus]CAF3547988.1 unnamed protein product [Didymodactylos carnosus]CAF3950485.1 unnamed protein product [Didymodactylos carnosus]